LNFSYPRKADYFRDPDLGTLYPPIDEIASLSQKEIKQESFRSGAHALNLLGLSTQVSMKMVYLTYGSQLNISIGNQSIKFKKTGPRNLAIKGKITCFVIQAPRETCSLLILILEIRIVRVHYSLIYHFLIYLCILYSSESS
jgi:hypothetical protein